MSAARRVLELMLYCLFEDGEPRDGAVLVESVFLRCGFHPGRLAEKRPELAELIREVVPDAFLKGAPFLELCIDRQGRQWCEHRTIDALIALAIGTGLGGFCAPREMGEERPAIGASVFFDPDAGAEPRGGP